VSLCGNNSYIKEWQPFQPKQSMSYTSPHHANERQRSVNNLWSCVVGSQGIAQIYELRSELSIAVIGKNSIYQRKHTDSKIIDIAICITCKKRLLAAEYVILVRYYYQTTTASELYESTYGPAGRPADNQANPDGLGDVHRTTPQSTVLVY